MQLDYQNQIFMTQNILSHTLVTLPDPHDIIDTIWYLLVKFPWTHILNQYENFTPESVNNYNNEQTSGTGVILT